AEPSSMKVKSISVMRVRGSVSLPASSSAGKARVLDGKAVVGGDKRSESGEALPAEAGMPVPGGDGGRTAAALSGDGGGEGGVALGAGGGTGGRGTGMPDGLAGAGSSGPSRFSTPLKICLQAPQRTRPAR